MYIMFTMITILWHEWKVSLVPQVFTVCGHDFLPRVHMHSRCEVISAVHLSLYVVGTKIARSGDFGVRAVGKC